MQPTFNPWIGYFDLIHQVDQFVFLDTVQLNQQSWQTRNKIKVANKEKLVAIPIAHNYSKATIRVQDAQINKNFEHVKKKLLKTLYQEYKNGSFFDETYEFVEKLLNFETQYLSDFNINIIQSIAQKIGITTHFLQASSIEKIDAKKALLVLELCKYLETKKYYSPFNAKDYLQKDLQAFEKENIKIIIQNYKHPMYNQQGNTFISHLGILDLLFNCGFENALSIITQGSNYENI